MSNALAQSILNDGFTNLAVNPDFLRPRLEIIRENMERITDDPDLAKLFPWHTHERDHYGKAYEQEIGLVLRTDDEHKWIFHYTPEAHLGQLPGVALDPLLRAYFLSLNDLNAKALAIATHVAEGIDQAALGAYDTSLAERIRKGRVITRILRYLRAHPGKSDAFPHLDRSCLTVHWGASHQGLWMYPPKSERLRIDETSNENVVVFPGRKFGAISSGKLGWGTPHGVKYERQVDEDRYSYISFIHPVSDEKEAAWLLARDAEMKAFERSLML